MDYHTLLAKVNYQKANIHKLIHETNERITNLKSKVNKLPVNDADLFEKSHQIIRLQSRLEVLKQQLEELEKITEKINTAILEDKIQASTIENYQIELELTKLK